LSEPKDFSLSGKFIPKIPNFGVKHVAPIGAKKHF